MPDGISILPGGFQLLFADVRRWQREAEAIRNFQTPSIATLVLDRDESVESNATENLFIEGGNLKVLTLL